MNVGVALGIASWLLVILVAVVVYVRSKRVYKAQRFAVTLINNEGAFIALRTETHGDRWVFEDVKITPTNPGAAYQAAAPGKLHVPTRNILYYQEIQEVSNATQ